MERVFAFAARRPWSALALLLAASLASASALVDPVTGELRLHYDPSWNRLLSEDDDEKLYYDHIRRLFGSDETMLVALRADDVFTAENLARVKRMTERIGEVDGVHHVVSLTNALNVRGNAEGLDVRPFVTEIPEDRAGLDRIRNETLENPVYEGNLVSSDGRTTALVVYFMNFSDRDFIARGIDARIEAIAREEAGDAEVWLTGGPHLKVEQYRFQWNDLERSLPLILLVSALVLALSFRTSRGVLLPIVTVVIALGWTLAFAAWLGRPLNMVTTLIPPLVLILGLSYCVHVVSEYYDCLAEDPGLTVREAAERALRRVWLPVVFTGVTTSAGFLALMVSPIGAIREFGELAVAGVVATVLAALTVPPALLGVMRRPRRLRGAGAAGAAAGADGFARFADRAAQFNLRYRSGIFAGTAAIGVLALLAATRVQVGADSIKSFPADSQVRRDFEAVNAHLEGANLFNVIVEGRDPGTFQEPDDLRALERLQDWLEAQPEIGGTTSIVEYLKLINRGFHENDPAYLAIPESKRLAAQLLFFGANDELEGFVDSGYRTANVIVRANVVDTELVSALRHRIEARLVELPEHLSARVTGNPILINGLFDDIVRGQAQSVIGAFALIYLILVALFLDWRTAFIALIPNTLPVAFYFGALGASGVTLNFATSLIAPMALGIAIDDTIHYFARFQRDAKAFADERRATASALRTVGRPVTYTTIAICAGFVMLTSADLRTFVQFGAMGAATLAFAWVIDFTLTPALCSGLRIVTLWDTLTLDLGDNPQESIPVFRGLSKAQCRIVALMASLREIPKGTALMRAGELGREMYVIIDGNVRIWIEGRDGPRELNTMARGDVVGTAGFFTAKRTTNVDVVEDARLLRLTPRNMERLRRRHPRIASTVFRNLNEVNAGLLAQSTAREQLM